MGQMEEAKDTQAVLDGNQNDIRILFDEIAAFLPRFSCRADLKSAAVNPYHDRLFLCTGILRLPYVQIQARFTLRIKGPNLPDAPLLAGRFSNVIRLIDTVIRHIVHRRFPPQLSDRLLPDKGNALVGNYILIRFFADKGAVDALGGQRLVILSIGDLLVLTVQCPHSLRCFLYALSHYVHNTCSFLFYMTVLERWHLR